MGATFHMSLADTMESALTGGQMTTLTTALSVAAERYDEHALEGACAWAFEASPLGLFMAQQFHQQAVDARALLAKITGD